MKGPCSWCFRHEQNTKQILRVNVSPHYYSCMLLRVFLFWLPMIVIAFANATLRELALVKIYEQGRADQLSTLTLAILCAVYVWFVFRFLNIQHSGQVWLAGLIWMLLTIAFESILGRLTHKPWSELLQQYNVFAGRLWPLFLLWLFLLPYLVYLLKR